MRPTSMTFTRRGVWYRITFENAQYQTEITVSAVRLRRWLKELSEHMTATEKRLQ